MVQGRWFAMGCEDISQPIEIRRSVFGRGRDALDDTSHQVVVYDGAAPVASARLWWQDGAFMLGEVGVLQDQRGRGFGDLLVRLLLYRSLTHGASLIALDTPEATEPFFAKYGFAAQQRADGMVRMTIRGEDVCLSHCGGNCADCANRTEACVPKALREN